MQHRIGELLKLTQHPSWKYIKLLAKIGVAVGVFLLVGKKINWSEVGEVLVGTNIAWFALAAITFMISKLIAGVRLWHFYKVIGIQVPLSIQLRLYVLGMFYNLFLPGGVGGDGYKVYWLRDREGANVKESIYATVLDRVSGLVGLLLLCLIGLPFISMDWEYQWVVIPAAILMYAGFWLLLRLFFRSFLTAFWVTNALSVLVQALQVLTAIWVMMALQVNEQWLDYLVIFLVSCIAFVIPVTPGGIGTREFVMTHAGELLGLNETMGFAIGFVFYWAIVVASLSGLWFLIFPGPLKRSE